MSLLSKLRAPAANEPLQRGSVGRDSRENHLAGRTDGRATPLHAPGTTADASSPRPGRFSNGLKEFLSQLEGIRRGNLLDVGPVSQDTLNFFIARGFKVYTEDLLTAWAGFVRDEEAQAKSRPPDQEAPDMSGIARADRFMAANLHHAHESFDAILLWDLLDYLQKDAASRVVAKLSAMMRPGGAILTIFHMRMPEQLQRYRVLDAQNLELVPSKVAVQAQHIFQNREIQDLFQGFRSSKYFVGRDQLREGVFSK